MRLAIPPAEWLAGLGPPEGWGMSRLWVPACLAMTLFAMTGCGNGDGAERRSHRAWTFMVYLDGDCDLEEAGVGT